MVKKAKCPVCGAKVSKLNLKRHMLRSHPGVGPDSVARPSWIRENWAFLAVAAALAVIVVSVLVLVRIERVPTAVLETTLGTFEVELYLKEAPITAGNFIDLAEEGFYDGLTFHRIVQDFIIQGGDPLGTGQGGSDQEVPWENTGLKNERYTVAMARAGDPNDPAYANTATSQFFVNLKDNPDLDGYAYPFVVFGKVVEGFEVVDAIGSLYPADPGDLPTQTVKMNVSIVYRQRISPRL